MKRLQSRNFRFDARYRLQNARLSIRDIYDVITELVTNCDDRYQILGTKGRIEIEVQRQRSGKGSILKVRDYADGMNSQTMDKKLQGYGQRISGLERGESVRGTNSRGAKDIAALGRASFESIPGDGYFHRCDIHHQFTPYQSEALTPAHRRRIGIAKGTGTLATVRLDPGVKVPQHEKLADEISRLVSLREILSDPNRTVVVKDLNQDKRDRVFAPIIDGNEKIKQTIEVPGYPGATAKLIVKRAHKQFEREKNRFRVGGILIKATHAVHEATLFDPRLEMDPHAAWFFGKLTCPYIDELWNEYDDATELQAKSDPKNPFPVVDPLRKEGLVREHPFVQALFGEALKLLRPLVENERKQAESQKAKVESRETRKRLDKLESAAAKFMEDNQEDDDVSRDPNKGDQSTRLKERGYSLNPPFAQLVCGHSQKFWLNIRQEAFPEFQVGTDVHIKCLTDDITSSKGTCGLEPHPTQEDVLRSVWTVKALKVTPATGIRVRVGSIVEETVIEVFATEADKYKYVTDLQFARKQYRVSTNNKKKSIVLMAPIALIPKTTPFEIECSSSDFDFSGKRQLEPSKATGVARSVFSVRSGRTGASGILTARVAGRETSVKLVGADPKGTGISIKLEDIDLGNQRYRWRHNVLEIAARHPSLRRYLGTKSAGFPGQEKQHFRVLVAEIVADAVCSKIVEKREAMGNYDDEDTDWNFFYAEYSKLTTEFLPMAHSLQVQPREA
jgi:hypothetical protein